MNAEAIRKELQNLSPEERAQILKDLMPELCRMIMSDPVLMQQMMPRCQEMMRDQRAAPFMRPMMEQIMKNMME